MSGIGYRWLFCNGKKEQAVKNVQLAARINGLPVLHVADINKDIVVEEEGATAGQIFALLLSFWRFL